MTTLNIKLQPQTEQRLIYLLSKETNEDRFFKDFITYKIAQLEKAIFNIEKDLRRFEKEYKVPSQIFYDDFEAGKYGDEDDFMIWSGIYEMLQESKSELNKIKW